MSGITSGTASGSSWPEVPPGAGAGPNGHAASSPQPARTGGQGKALLLSGKPVRLRGIQMTYWSTAAGLLFAALVAGLYFGILQVHWWLPLPGHPGFWLKGWWDAGPMWLRHAGNWALYRHGAFRDLAEPAIATMGVLTLNAKPRYWSASVGTVRLVTAPVILLALTFGLGVLGIWLLYFGLPDGWAHAASALGHPGFTLDSSFAWAGKLSAGQLLAGALIGKVLHRFWAPVGATLQGYPLDRAVDRARATGRIPAWERLPTMIPVVRERFAKMYREDTETAEPGKSRRKVLAAVLTVAVLLVILGLIGHYWVGVLHHTVPYLAPGH